MPGKKPHDYEAHGPLHEGHSAGDDAPGYHNARDPDSRPHFLQDDVARHLKQEISKEEDSCAPAEDVGTEPQILVHRQRRETDIGPVDISDEVDDDDERQ